MKRSNSLPSWYKSTLKLFNQPLFVFPVLVLLTFLLYGRSLTSWGVADDLSHLRGALLRIPPLQTFFRPLERFVNELDVRWLGYDNLFLSRAVNLLGFFVTLAATYALGRLLWPAAARTVLAVVLLVVSPLAPLTVVQIDAISQQYATVFALLFLLVLLAAVQRRSPGLYLLGYSFAFLALLAKETAPGVVAAAPLAVGLIGLRRGVYKRPRQAFQTLLANYFGIAVVAALYAAVRLASGYGFDDESPGRYDLALTAVRLARNLALYLASLLYSGSSSLDIFPAVLPWRVAVSSLLTFVLLVVALVGFLHVVLTRLPKAINLLALFLLVIAGSFPAILTAQVSELYVYSSLPFYALLLSFCFAEGVALLSNWSRTPKVRYGATLFLSCLIVWLSYGTSEKITLITQANGQSWGYFSQALAFFEETPDATLKLCWSRNEGKTMPTYSTFFLGQRHIAGRAILFASVVDRRTFYLFADNSLLATSYRSGPPSPALRRASCSYQLELTEQGLQFL